MYKSRRSQSFFVLSAVAMLVTGCGGGGGDSDPASATPATQPMAVLNSANQNFAAQDALSIAFSPFSGVQTLTGVQSADDKVLLDIARQQIDKFPEYMAQAKSQSTLTGVTESATMACPFGGSMTITAIDGDNNNTVSAGDSLTLVANNCGLDAGTASGSMAFNFNTVSGNYQSSASTNYSLGVTMVFDNFAVTSPGAVASMNGSLSMRAEANGVNTLTETISTPSLSVSASYAGESRTRNLTGYSASSARAPNATYGYLTSYNFSGTVSSSALDSKSISFATTTPFVQRPNDVYSSSGAMLVTGDSRSTVKLTALNNSQVRQELDANGDGVFEESKTVNWNSLM